MAQINDGGPAFPLAYTETNEHGVQFPFTHPGMSMRDWFAGQALAGMVAGAHGSEVSMSGLMDAAAEHGWPIHTVCAKAAYGYADAMLAERAKGGGRG